MGVSVVVVDDGSHDHTSDVVAGLRDDRVTYVRQAHAGVSAARNRGVRESSSEYVTFLDSDDMALDGWAAAMADRARRGVGLFSCGAAYRYDDGRQEQVLPRRYGPAYENVTALFLAGTFLLRRDLFDTAGGYREGLTFGENSDLGMRVGEAVVAGRCSVDSTEQLLVRVHARDRVYDAALRYATATRLLDESFDVLSKDRRLLATHYAIAGVAASRLGHRRTAVGLLARAVRHEPLRPVHVGRFARALVSRSGAGSTGVAILSDRQKDPAT
jgi:glycosyltransferase involved in cell wall biosynthesis